MKCYEEKCRLLKEQLSRYASEDVAVAFSGGVDSSLLLKIVCEAARETGKKVYGVFLRTMLHPQGELEEAMQVAQETGAIFHVIEVDELEEADIADNPADRCYRCKRYLFQVMKEEMKLLQVYRILEGTNEDDLHVYRPGIRAVRELGMISPLADDKEGGSQDGGGIWSYRIGKAFRSLPGNPLSLWNQDNVSRDAKGRRRRSIS